MMSSSSVDDQAAIIPDRLECLLSLSQPLLSSNGIQINDVLPYFVSDHKAMAFGQGAQCVVSTYLSLLTKHMHHTEGLNHVSGIKYQVSGIII